MALKIAQFLALVLTALALLPAGAHLLELPNKIDLPQDRYFVVQDIYRGWWLLGSILLLAIVANIYLTVKSYRFAASFWLAILAALFLVGSLTIFFIWTYPTNVETNNWTSVPANWAELRTRWEYSHAANAAMIFGAYCSVVLSSLLARG